MSVNLAPDELNDFATVEIKGTKEIIFRFKPTRQHQLGDYKIEIHLGDHDAFQPLLNHYTFTLSVIESPITVTVTDDDSVGAGGTGATGNAQRQAIVAPSM